MSKALEHIQKFFLDHFSHTMPPKANGKLAAWNKELEKRYEKDLQDRLSLSADQERLCQGIQHSLFELPPSTWATHRSKTETQVENQDFERCQDFRQWHVLHGGQLPNRHSNFEHERSFAGWLANARARHHRAMASAPSKRQLTVEESNHLDDLWGPWGQAEDADEEALRKCMENNVSEVTPADKDEVVTSELGSNKQP